MVMMILTSVASLPLAWSAHCSRLGLATLWSSLVSASWGHGVCQQWISVHLCTPSPTFMGLPCSLMADLMVLMLWSRLSISILVSSTVSSALRLAASVSAIRSSNALK